MTSDSSGSSVTSNINNLVMRILMRFSALSLRSVCVKVVHYKWDSCISYIVRDEHRFWVLIIILRQNVQPTQIMQWRKVQQKALIQYSKSSLRQSVYVLTWYVSSSEKLTNINMFVTFNGALVYATKAKPTCSRVWVLKLMTSNFTC